jgi:hypothetical protein
VARDLKAIYQAPTLEAAEEGMEAFSAQWDSRFPQISRMWRALGEPDAVLRLPARDPEGYLHDERRGVGERPATQDDQAPGRLPDSRLSEESVVPGDHESQ